MKMPQRSKILESVDRYQQRDPELYRELKRKATDPDDDEKVFPIARKAAEILEELEPKLDPARQARAARGARATRARRAGPAAVPAEVDEVLAPLPAGFDAEVTAYERRV